MSSKISKRKQPEREVKPIKERLKISNKVLDDKVIEILSWLMNTRKVDSFDYPISQGKEAVVFRATRLTKDGKPEFIAVKIFKYETSSFHHISQYIEGDRNFDMRKNKRLMINDWCKKEYVNLMICQAHGIRAPKPYFYRTNVVIMEFLGVGEYSSALLEEVVLEDPQATYDDICKQMKKIYDAGLVHADLSSFNIIMHKGLPYIIDWAQGLGKDHPNADNFLKKDCHNIADYFSRQGIDADEKKLYHFITKKNWEEGAEIWKR